MRWTAVFIGLLVFVIGPAQAADPTSIVIVDSATPAAKAKVQPPNMVMGEQIIHAASDPPVQVGVWEASKSITRLENYPFTEYCLMISGRVVITDADGTQHEFKAGDTFVMPKGFTGVWDIREKMKKQFVKVGDPNAKVSAIPVTK